MPAVSARDVAAVRRFNRLYTARIGALDAAHLGSPYSLTEVRVLYELAHRPHATARAIARDLALDEGYLSRVVTRFEKAGLVRRTASRADARVSELRLTAKGRREFGALDARANQAVQSMLAGLEPVTREAVVTDLGRLHGALAPGDAARVVLRPHRPGDMGWLVHRHGALYAREYGYDERFEGIVAGVVAEFLAHRDPKRERCWIAERSGEILGSVMLVRKTARTAKLRLLYLEPHARGLGLGRRLVNECIAFARAAGYTKITLWTQSSLAAARHIYETAGFRLTDSHEHEDFGPREAAETWELIL